MISLDSMKKNSCFDPKGKSKFEDCPYTVCMLVLLYWLFQIDSLPQEDTLAIEDYKKVRLVCIAVTHIISNATMYIRDTFRVLDSVEIFKNLLKCDQIKIKSTTFNFLPKVAQVFCNVTFLVGVFKVWRRRYNNKLSAWMECLPEMFWF